MKDWTEKGRTLIWHPFTQMKEWEKENPTIIVEGKGVYLTDLDGKKYLDGVSSIWVNLHGHRNKKIDRALIRQIRKLSHSTLFGLSNLPAIKLAEKLIKIAPKGLAKVFYSDDGSTAVEVAVKIAFGFWRHRGKATRKKTKFISFSNAYHGDTVGSVSLGGIDLFHQAYRPLLFQTIKAPATTRKRSGLDEIEKVMKRRHKEIAGLVIEPMVQAAAGILISPPGYLKEIRRLCSRYEILMIADEVATGFGRTGKMFACEHEGVTPDLMAISKGITGGYLPLAATLTTQEIYDAFLGEYSEFKTFFHGHSYTGNPLGCAAAIANLEIFEEEKVLRKLQPKIAFVEEALRSWKEWPHVGDIRQTGFMIGIELVADKQKRTPYPLEMRVGGQICNETKAHGVLLRPLGNVIVLMPPLSIAIRDLKKLISVTGAAIQTVTERLKVSPSAKDPNERQKSSLEKTYVHGAPFDWNRS